jgi:hypothetical protein
MKSRKTKKLYTSVGEKFIPFGFNAPELASFLTLVAADLRAVTERCNRSDIAPDLLLAASKIMAARRAAATF